MLKCNAEFVDVIFRLMFETFWVPTYDRRRSDPLLIEFERCARHTSVLLGATDDALATEIQLRALGKAVDALEQSVLKVIEARLFLTDVCNEALEFVAQIKDGLPAACNAGVKSPVSHDPK